MRLYCTISGSAFWKIHPDIRANKHHIHTYIQCLITLSINSPAVLHSKLYRNEHVFVTFQWTTSAPISQTGNTLTQFAPSSFTAPIKTPISRTAHLAPNTTVGPHTATYSATSTAAIEVDSEMRYYQSRFCLNYYPFQAF